jgi:hypothetical protein
VIIIFLGAAFNAERNPPAASATSAAD